MVGAPNRPTTRSQSKANANLLNNNDQDSKLAADITTKLNNLPEKAAQATAELNQNLHKQRVSFIIRSLRESRNDAWRFCAVDEIFRNSKF